MPVSAGEEQWRAAKVIVTVSLGVLKSGAIGFDRSTFHYQSRRTDQAAVAKRIREICETRVRYGYRRVHVLLDREGLGIPKGWATAFPCSRNLL